MMKKLIGTIIALVIGNVAFAQQVGLKINYNFDNNINDHSGNDNHATNKGTSYTKDANGNSKSALYVGGDKTNGGYLQIPDVVDGENAITISIDAKYISYLANNYEEALISFGSLKNGGNGATGIYYRQYDKRLVFCVKTDNGEYSFGQAWNKKWNNTFTKFSLTYNAQSGTMTGYVNDQKVGEKTGLSGSIKTLIPDAGIGKHWWASGAASSTRLEAAFDNLYVFNKTLSLKEISDLRKKQDTCFFTVYDTVLVKKYVTVTDTMQINLSHTYSGKPAIAKVQVYPNPAQKLLFISCPFFEKTNDIDIEIFNSTGQKVYSGQLNKAILQIDIAIWPDGFYALKFREQGQLLEEKTLIIRQ